MVAADNKLVWRKSSYSSNGSDCVEVAFAAENVAARDSKDPEGPALRFDEPQWKRFVGALRNGSLGT
ncbi:DUF397 domain-containing protein [Haloactinomyces albus]|uniref:DUF397 domain-containing protein n=1 Tax=Haloactinomyces albus TaxID=1352928 RepID=A0AAE4CJH3_9ACTN|nr:DUF397 domain-containing protein [Haloactinomyces albus]MDR7299995.1 hypothetical protein [Haloactinomyces albus]